MDGSDAQRAKMVAVPRAVPSAMAGAVAAAVPGVVRRALVDLLPYQRAAVTGEGRFTWNCWARQTGKSFLLAMASDGERTVVVDSGIDGRRTERGKFSLRRVLRGLERRRNQIILSAGERQSR